MKKLFTILFSLFFAMGLFAQISDYEFTTFVEKYQDLENPTPLTNGIWDDPNFTIPLGFDFIFHGDTVNTLNANDDLTGGILYVGDGDSTGVNLIFPYGSDIIDLGYSSGKSLSTISYEITGEPGNQIAKVEWKNVGFYDEVANTYTGNNSLSFQAWFYEGTNDIEIRFGPNAVKDNSLHDFGGPLIGFASSFDIDETTFDTLSTLEGDPMMPEIVNSLSLNNTVPVLNGHPENGRVYKFGYQFQNTTTNIESVNLLRNVEIYPTIVEDNIQIKINEDFGQQEVQLSIHNVLGSELLNKIILSGHQTIHLNSLEKGYYFVKIQVGNNYEVRKIMKL